MRDLALSAALMIAYDFSYGIRFLWIQEIFRCRRNFWYDDRTNYARQATTVRQGVYVYT